MINTIRSKWRRFNSVTKLSLVPPVAQPGRHGAAIATVVKNESRHIGEWACFHRDAGVRHFIIYDNGSTDGTVDVARAALPSEALTVVAWRQRLEDARLGRAMHNQVLAYAHAASNFGDAFRWMAFIDVDEFLVPKQADSIPAAIAHLEDCQNLSLPWHMFGTSGHKTPPEDGVLRNYLRRAPVPAGNRLGLYNFKCLVDPCHLTAVRVHSMETDGSDHTCNDRGDGARNRHRHNPGFYSADYLQLNHYFTRSEAEVTKKMRRGQMMGTNSQRYMRKVQSLVEHIEKETVEDRTALTFLERIGAIR